MITSRLPGISSSSFLNAAMLKREQPHRGVGDHAGVAGLVADEGHLADDRPGADVGDVLTARVHAGVAGDHEEALGADVALVHEDGAGLGVDRLADLGDPARRRARGRWRTAAAGAGPR